jgi:hypothetical protein
VIQKEANRVRRSPSRSRNAGEAEAGLSNGLQL